MASAILNRFYESDQGTKSVLLAFNNKQEKKSFRILELPWRNNEQNISRIPNGKYNCKIHKSKKFGTVYHIENVENRTWILTHSGNFAGDTSKGFKTHSYGCLIIGKYFGVLSNQLAVLLSRVTLKDFMNFMNYENFELTIRTVI